MRFEIIGKIEKAKSDKITFFEEKVSDGGWISRALKFNVKSGNNTFLMEVRGGRSKDDSKALIYSTIKKEDGKYENVQFLHKDKEKYISKLAEFKKSVIVFDKDTRLDFATSYDFALALKDIVESEQYADVNFKVVGEVEYSKYNGKEYKKMIIMSLTLLIIIIAIVTILTKDMDFGAFKTVSVAGVSDKSVMVDTLIKQEKVVKSQHESTLDELEQAKNQYEVSKKAFDNIDDSTIDMVLDATKDEKYFIEYFRWN